jgi:hypothetical protein
LRMNELVQYCNVKDDWVGNSRGRGGAVNLPVLS